MKTKIQTLLIITLIGMVVISGCLNQTTDTNTKSQVEEQHKDEKLELKEEPEKTREKTTPKESDWCTRENFNTLVFSTNTSVFGAVFASTDPSAKWDLISVAIESKTIKGEVIEMCCGKMKIGGKAGNEKVKMEIIYNTTACYDKNNKYEFIDMKSYYNGEYNPEGSYVTTGWPESGKECHKVIDGNGKLIGEGCE